MDQSNRGLLSKVLCKDCSTAYLSILDKTR